MIFLDLDGTTLDVTKRHYATYVDVLGLSLSVEGLWGAWNILVKATIG